MISVDSTARWLEYDWRLIRDEPTAPRMHMALDEVLTLEVANGRRPPTLRIWEWDSNAVILGRFQSVRNEVDPEGAAKHGMTIARRITGGGAMLIEPHNAITYSLYAPDDLVKGMSFIESYEFLDRWVIAALNSLGINSHYQPINDITSDKGKIGGAAQTRRAGAVLHHVTMAYDMNPAVLLEVLRIGREKLSDKGSVSANKRVAPIRQQTDLPRETVIQRLVDVFAERYGSQPDQLTSTERKAADTLRLEKFETDDWLYLLP